MERGDQRPAAAEDRHGRPDRLFVLAEEQAPLRDERAAVVVRPTHVRGARRVRRRLGGVASVWPVLAASRYGCFLCWLLPVLAASRTGCFPCWLLPVLAASRTGCFPCWLLPVLAASRTGCFPCWLLPVMAASRYGCFPCWLLTMLAASRTGCFPYWLLPVQLLRVMATFH